MKFDEQEQNNIDDYERGYLNNENKTAFELMLSKDVELQKEVQVRTYIDNYFEYKKVLDTIEQAKYANENNFPNTDEEEVEKVKDLLNQAKIENTKNKKRKIIWFSALASAASFFIISWFAGFWLNETTTYETSHLRTTLSLKQTQIENVSLSNDEAIQQLIDEANSAMEKDSFNIVLSKFRSLRNLGFGTDEMRTYESFIYYKKKSYVNVENCFAKIIDKDTEAGNEARWFLSLAYLEDAQKEKAKNQLSKIEGYYKQHAKTKLIEMNR